MEPPGLPQMPRPSPWYHEFLPVKEPFTQTFTLDASVNVSVLCSRCQPVQSWVQANWDFLRITHQDFEHSFDHCDTGLRLQSSFLSGCHLCTLIWHSFDPTSTYSYQNRFVKRERAIPKVLDGKNVKIRAYNKGTSGPTLAPYLTSFEDEIIDGEAIPLKCYDSMVELGSSSNTISTNSSAARCLAENWIRECTTSHATCRQRRTSNLPGRILDVLVDGAIDKVRVVDTHSLSGDIQYAALSYCWGNRPQYKLTSSTLNDFNSGVAIQGFPKTIRDAIETARNIGLKWLWVDSLCILQDCPKDWDRESSKMCDVYQNSFLTLAALGASNSDDGLYALRDPLIYLPCELFRTAATEIICAGHDTSPRLGIGTWPLHQRRWVIQERILSPRTLNFGPYLTWQCREKSLDEYDILRHRTINFGADLSRQFFDTVVHGRMLRMPYQELEDAIMDVWGHILVSYLEAALSVQSDSLKAISGVITAIQKRTGWKNLAGLWEPFLWRELLWEKDTFNSGQPTGLSPTWSWISISGGITGPSDEPTEGFFLHPISSVKEAESIKADDSKRDDGAELRMSLQISCVPVGIGQVYSIRNTERIGVDLIDWPWAGRVRYTPDSVSSTRTPEQFLPLATGDWEEFGWEVLGLAVSPSTSCPGAFERVGYISVSCENGPESLPDEAYAIFLEPRLRQSIILV